MEKAESETDTMDLDDSCQSTDRSKIIITDRQDTITFIPLTVHFDIIIAPFLDQVDCKPCFHDPGEQGIQTENDLSVG